MKKKALIVLGGSVYDLPFIKVLKRKKYYLFVVDVNISAPGLKFADYPVNLSIKDVDSLVRFFKKEKEHYDFIAITSVDTEANRAIAALSSLLEINSFDFELSDIFSNKFKLYKFLFSEENLSKKKIFKGLKLKFIPSSIVWYYEDLLNKINENQIEFPFILKPTENSGSTGVIIVNRGTSKSANNLKKAFLYSKNYSPTGEIIIQKYIKGEVFKIVFLAGKSLIQPIFVWKIFYNNDKYPLEIYRTNKIDIRIIKKLILIGETIIKKINFKNCPVEIKVIKQNDCFYLLDINLRLEGGFFIDKAIFQYIEYDIIENYLKIVTGIDPNKFNILDFINNKKRNYIFIKKIYDNQKINFNLNNRKFELYSVTNNFSFLDLKSSKYYSNIIYSISKKIPDFNKIKIGEIFNLIEYEKTILKNAKINLNGSCQVCKICDGKGCIGQLPGMGGKNLNEIFIKNYYDLRKLKIDSSFYSKTKISEKLIRTIKNKTYFDFFGYKVKFPIFVAPVTGITSNLGGKLDETKFYFSLLKGAYEEGYLAFLGDGSSEKKYLFMDKILKKVFYNGIITLKPRGINIMIEHIRYFNEKPIKAIAIDVDSFNLPTMNKKDSFIKKYSIMDILTIKQYCTKALIIKGVMDFYDMIKLAKYNFDSFIISNHGGRVSSSMSSSINVLKSIDIKYLKRINKKLKIGIDGGFRNGEDIIKAFLLGADYVLIGRPFAIYAAGDGIDGVKFLFNKYIQQINDYLKFII